MRIEENERYTGYLTEWCPCGCGRKVTRQQKERMQKENISHTSNQIGFSDQD